MSFDGDNLILDGAARDLVTNESEAIVTASARLTADLGDNHVLRDLKCAPHAERSATLVGLLVGRGFRDAVAREFADDVASGNPLSVLLDEMPVAAGISDYARSLNSNRITNPDRTMRMIGICAGFRPEGRWAQNLLMGDPLPVPIGPDAPVLESTDDPYSWHLIGPLAVGAMRRRRLIDITPGEQLQVNAMFRDSYVRASGVEMVLHEYTVTALIDPDTSTVLSCDAVPFVIPQEDCPIAASSAQRIVGHPIDEVRKLVRSEFHGDSTCTHLNDLLRSLGDIGVLVATLEATLV